MAVECWSFHREDQVVGDLPDIGRTGFKEFASLGTPVTEFRLPARLLIQGKATFRRTTGFLNGLPLQPIQTLLVDTLLGPAQPLDEAWCSLTKSDDDTATISVLATVDAPAHLGSGFRPHVISWRVAPQDTTFDIRSVWLTAIALDALAHREG